jgi:hypothetical protein
MNPMFQKMVEAKKAEGKEFSPVEKTASDKVLADLMHFLSGLEGDKLKGLKKVTVASNDPQGLTAGLDKAKAMVDGQEGSEDPMVEATETPDEETKEDGQEGMEASEGDGSESHEDPDSMEALQQQMEMLKAKMAAKGHSQF